jgi:hypothetical protein
MENNLEDSLKLGVAANLARHYAGEGRALLSPLARLFADTLGERAEIKMSGGFLSKKVITGVVLHLGEWSYTLEDAGGDPKSGPLVATRTRRVRGIALKTEDLPMAAWLEEVGLALEVEAQSNQAIHEALSRWVW